MPRALRILGMQPNSLAGLTFHQVGSTLCRDPLFLNHFVSQSD